MAEITLDQINKAIASQINEHMVDILTMTDVKKEIKKQLSDIELPAYEEQIAKLTTELNATREALNKLSEEHKTAIETINKLIAASDEKIKQLSVPKKSILDEVVLPE